MAEHSSSLTDAASLTKDETINAVIGHTNVFHLQDPPFASEHLERHFVLHPPASLQEFQETKLTYFMLAYLPTDLPLKQTFAVTNEAQLPEFIRDIVALPSYHLSSRIQRAILHEKNAGTYAHKLWESFYPPSALQAEVLTQKLQTAVVTPLPSDPPLPQRALKRTKELECSDALQPQTKRTSQDANVVENDALDDAMDEASVSTIAESATSVTPKTNLATPPLPPPHQGGRVTTILDPLPWPDNKGIQSPVVVSLKAADGGWNSYLNTLSQGLNFQIRTAIKGANAELYAYTLEDFDTLRENVGSDYHTYMPKSRRQFRIVVRGLPPSLTDDDVKDACYAAGLPRPDLARRLPRRGGAPSYCLTLGFSARVDRVKFNAITYLANVRVTWESPKPRAAGNPHYCQRCGQIWHSSTGCKHPPRCLLCASFEHDKEHCTIDTPVKCINCSGAHPTTDLSNCPKYQAAARQHATRVQRQPRHQNGVARPDSRTANPTGEATRGPTRGPRRSGPGGTASREQRPHLSPATRPGPSDQSRLQQLDTVNRHTLSPAPGNRLADSQQSPISFSPSPALDRPEDSTPPPSPPPALSDESGQAPPKNTAAGPSVPPVPRVTASMLRRHTPHHLRPSLVPTADGTFADSSSNSPDGAPPEQLLPKASRRRQRNRPKQPAQNHLLSTRRAFEAIQQAADEAGAARAAPTPPPPPSRSQPSHHDYVCC